MDSADASIGLKRKALASLHHPVLTPFFIYVTKALIISAATSQPPIFFLPCYSPSRPDSSPSSQDLCHLAYPLLTSYLNHVILAR